MTATMIPMTMYTSYVDNQLIMNETGDKKKFWLLAEESKLSREAVKESRNNPEKATDILLAYMERLTFIRKYIEVCNVRLTF